MTDDLIDILRRSRRSCSVAEIVSGRPVDSGPISCMGGGFYGRPDEVWPTNDHGLMLPLFQIAFAQVPIIPESLKGFSLLTMFLDRRQLPMDGDAPNGDGWLMRAYQGDDQLVPLAAPAELWVAEHRHFAFNKQFPPRVTRLSWRKSEEDFPGWEDYGRLLPHFDWDFDDLHPKYREIAKHEYGTKRSPSTNMALKSVDGQPTSKAAEPARSMISLFRLGARRKRAFCSAIAAMCTCFGRPMVGTCGGIATDAADGSAR